MTKVVRTLSYNVSVDALRDLSCFLEATGGFGKKFYNLEYTTSETDGIGEVPGDPSKHHIWVQAIGISRDLTYKIKWKILCGKNEDLDKGLEHIQGTKFIRYETPRFGYIPVDSDIADVYFPARKRNEIEAPFLTVFDDYGFILVDEIED